MAKSKPVYPATVTDPSAGSAERLATNLGNAPTKCPKVVAADAVEAMVVEEAEDAGIVKPRIQSAFLLNPATCAKLSPLSLLSRF
jgi:hypothetical protein